MPLAQPSRRFGLNVALSSACILLLLTSIGAAQYPPVKDKPLPRIMGLVRDDGGGSVPDTLIRLEPENPGSVQPTPPVATALSDESGKYVIVAPSPGRYILRAWQAGFATVVVKEIALAQGDSLTMDLQLHVGRGGGVAVEPLAQPPSAAPPAVQFSDDTNFTIAGVTDRSNMGLHGSDANVRTSDDLAKEAAALKSSAPNGPSASRAGDAHRLAGDAKEKSDDPIAAAKEYQAAVAVDPSEQNYFAWGAELLLHRAAQAAAPVFGKGVAAHPDSARLLAGLGASYYANGQFNEAAAQLCRASDLNPRDPQPYLFLGKMEQAAPDPLPCAQEKLARFVSEQPRNSYANLYYGLVLFKNARKSQDIAEFASAETYLLKAATIDPSLAEVYLQLGLLYNARGEKSSAMASFQRAVAASPQLSAAHYQLSLAYRRAGNLAKAERELKTYQKLKNAEDAQLAKERREMRQFVTVLQDGKASQP